MLGRALRAMGDPEAFFRWLAGEPPSGARAFVVPLAGTLLAGAMGLLMVYGYGGDAPEIRPVRTLIDDAGMPPGLLAAGMVVIAAPGAALTWAMTWIPIRLGAGAGARLWEIAAWCQVPQVALAALQLILTVSLPVSRGLAPGLTAIGVAWSAWFVHAGVRELSGRHALRAALVFFVYSIALPLAGFVSQTHLPHPGSAPGMMG